MRIAVIGPQNTGKSTFIRDLLSALPEYTTPEKSYREHVLELGLQINQLTSETSQRSIRDFMHEQLKTNTKKNVIFDRCIVDNHIYTLAKNMVGGIRDAYVKESEEVMYESLKYLDVLLFIPTAVTVKLESDELRDIDGEFIDTVNKLFLETLLPIVAKQAVQVEVISGGREKRVQEARKKLDL